MPTFSEHMRARGTAERRYHIYDQHYRMYLLIAHTSDPPTLEVPRLANFSSRDTPWLSA